MQRSSSTLPSPDREVLPSAHFKTRDAAGRAASEPIDLDAHILRDTHKGIREWGVVCRILGQIGAVSVSSAGKNDGEVPPVMAACISEV